MSDQSELTVAVAGATGALGSELLAILERAPWNPTRVIPLASTASTVPFITWKDQQVAVDDLANLDLAEVDLLFVAVPEAIGRPIVHEALDEGVPVVDCSGALKGDPDMPAVVPWVNPGVLSDLPRRAAQVPASAATLLGGVLGPLARAGIEGSADATVLLPASHWGRSGIDELSRQVVTLFNAGTPPRKVFPDGLAFDLLPQVGIEGEAGWTDQEQAVAAQAQHIGAWEGTLSVSLIGMPVFSGVSAEIRIRPLRPVPPELVRRILLDGGNRAPEEEGARFLPRPRRVEGNPFNTVGRVRVDEAGHLTIWSAMDNLRASATVAVATGGAILRDTPA